ncbi:MAG: HIT family protein [Thermoplasmata archaeon]|nr:HIT family protein [Thermoplasmata archaeon]
MTNPTEAARFPNASADVTSPSHRPTVDCMFCQRATDFGPLSDRCVYEDSSFHASHQIYEDGPSYLGIILIQTKRHVPNLAALSDSESERLGWLIGRLSRALGMCTPAEWTYCFGFTEGVRHVHMLIAARYPGMPKEYVRLAIADWPGAPHGDPIQVAELVSRLRSAVGRPGPP